MTESTKNSKESTSTNKKKKELDPRCCQSWCEDCPFGFDGDVDPSIPRELKIKIEHTEDTEEEKRSEEEQELTEDQKKYLDQADN